MGQKVKCSYAKAMMGLSSIELMFLGDALGVIKDRWISTHMEEDYEFVDN